MIQKAITKNLAARGVTRVSSGGDITVPYLVIVGDNASTTAIRAYFGYGDDLGDLHDRAQKAYTRQRIQAISRSGHRADRHRRRKETSD